MLRDAISARHLFLCKSKLKWIPPASAFPSPYHLFNFKQYDEKKQDKETQKISKWVSGVSPVTCNLEWNGWGRNFSWIFDKQKEMIFFIFWREASNIELILTSAQTWRFASLLHPPNLTNEKKSFSICDFLNLTLVTCYRLLSFCFAWGPRKRLKIFHLYVKLL